MECTQGCLVKQIFAERLQHGDNVLAGVSNKATSTVLLAQSEHLQALLSSCELPLQFLDLGI